MSHSRSSPSYTWFAPSAPTSASSSRSFSSWLHSGCSQAHISRQRWETWYWPPNYKRYITIAPIFLFHLESILIFVPTGGRCVQFRTLHSDLAYFHCTDARCGRFPYRTPSGWSKYSHLWKESKGPEAWDWGLVLVSSFGALRIFFQFCELSMALSKPPLQVIVVIYFRKYVSNLFNYGNLKPGNQPLYIYSR